MSFTIKFCIFFIFSTLLFLFKLINIESCIIKNNNKCINDSYTRCDDEYNKCCYGLTCNRDTHESYQYGNCQ